MRQSRLCANQCWSAKTFKASISPRYLGFRPQAASQWWTRGAVPVAALVIQRHGLNSFEVQGVLNRWGSAWENCKKLIDSHCSLLPPFFKYSVQVCPASLWAEMDLLAVNPETLRRQASRACYTEHLHHQAPGLEARVMQINQIRCKRLNWEQAIVKQMATIATQCLLTHPLQQPHTLRVQHSGCTYVSQAEKNDGLCRKALLTTYAWRFWSYWHISVTPLNLPEENEEERLGDGRRWVSQPRTYTTLKGSTTFPWLLAQPHTTQGFAAANPSYDKLKTKHHVGWCSSGSKGHDRVVVHCTRGDLTTTLEQILQKLQKKQQARSSKNCLECFSITVAHSPELQWP